LALCGTIITILTNACQWVQAARAKFLKTSVLLFNGL
jgi:hypothetical protein